MMLTRVCEESVHNIRENGKQKHTYAVAACEATRRAAGSRVRLAALRWPVADLGGGRGGRDLARVRCGGVQRIQFLQRASD